MKRWKKVTIWVASILIVLVTGGFFAANYAVDKVLDSMVGMSIDDLLEEVDTEVVGDDTEMTPKETTSPDDSGDQADDVDSSNQTDVTEQGSNSNAGGQDTDSASSASTGKQQGSSEKSKDDKVDSGYTAEISTDKAKEVQDNITVAEKAKVVTTLMGSLSASDISTLQKLASGGLSVDEKKEARDIMLEKLSEDQYNDLISIAAKHGLSQGRAYSDVKDE